MANHTHAEQIALFQSRASVVERLFSAGRIGPFQRREMLIRACDLTDIPKLAATFREKSPGTTQLAQMTEEEYRNRRAAQRRRNRQRHATVGEERGVHVR
jgi:hypothetical protein